MASTYSRLNDSSTELTATSSSDVVVNVDSQDAAAAVLSPTAFVMMLLRDRMDSGVVVRTVLEYSGGALDRVLFYTRSGDWVAARIVSIGPGITLQLSLLTAGGSGAAAGEAVESRLGSRRLLPPDSDPSFRQRASAAAEMALAEDELAHMRAVAALDPPAPVGADGADGDRLLGPDHREASAFALLRSVWAVPVRVWGFAPTLHLAASLLLMWIAVEGDPDGGVSLAGLLLLLFARACCALRLVADFMPPCRLHARSGVLGGVDGPAVGALAGRGVVAGVRARAHRPHRRTGSLRLAQADGRAVCGAVGAGARLGDHGRRVGLPRQQAARSCLPDESLLGRVRRLSGAAG